MKQSDFLPIGPVTLRFESPNLEQEFLKMMKGRLALSIKRLSLCGLSCCCLVLVYTVYTAHTRKRASNAFLVLTIDLSISCLLFIASMCVMAVPLAVQKVVPLVLEIWTTCFWVWFFITTQCFVDEYYSFTIFGANPGEDHVYTDTRLLFTLASLLTISHVVLPIRWYILAVHYLCSVLVYSWCAFIVGSPEGPTSAMVNLVMITAFSLFVLYGKWNLEYLERSVFFSSNGGTIHGSQRDVSLKAQATPGGVPESRGSESVPETSSTGKVFEGAMADNLEGVVDIGQKEHWLIELDELELRSDKVLGRGGFGVVVAGTYRGFPVAVKMTLSSPTKQGGRDILSLFNEVRFLRKLRHPNIVFFHGLGFCSAHDEVALVLEYVDGMSLKSFILLQANLMPEIRMKLVQEVASALTYLHSRSPKIIHGDLKDSNIFVETVATHPSAKLLDFGLSRAMTKNAKPLGGTPVWIAPEILTKPGRPPQTAADVFAFGQVMFFVLTGVRPSTPPANRGQWPHDMKETQQCEPIIDCCIQVRPSSRPKIETVFRMLSEDGVEKQGRKVRHVCQVIKQVRDVHRSHEILRSNQLHETDAAVQDNEACEKGTGCENGTGFAMLHPAYLPTPLSTQARSLVANMAHWNYRVQKQDSCCLFHAALQQLNTIGQALQKAPCKNTWGGEAYWQCQECKAVLLTDTQATSVDATPIACTFCGGTTGIAKGPTLSS